MKRNLSFILALVLLISSLAACSDSKVNNNDSENPNNHPDNVTDPTTPRQMKVRKTPKLQKSCPICPT